MNAIPAADCFEVFFVPAAGSSLRLCAPIRIGEPMVDKEDARDLAEVAATDLPVYGFPRGEVLIQQNTAVVWVLPTIAPTSGHSTSSSTRADVGSLPCAWSQQEVARLALEDLRRQVSRAKPTQAAPPTWIACLHHVQQVIATAVGQRDELPDRDRQPFMTVDTLYRRVLAVQDQFDELTAAPDPGSPARDGSLPTC